MPDHDAEQIVIGPLRARWWRIAFALAWLLLLGGAASLGLQTIRFACERDARTREASCELRHSAPMASVERFAPGTIASVEMTPRTTGKAREPNLFSVDVLDGRGREWRIEGFSTAADALRERDALRAFLRDDSAPRWLREHPPGLGAFAWFAGVCAVGLAILAHSFGPAGRLHLRIDREAERLLAWRTLFGVRRGAVISVPLREIADVRLELGVVRDALLSRGQRPPPGGRLCVVAKDDRSRPLTRAFLADLPKLNAGLDALQRALGLAVQSRPSEDDGDHGSLVAHSERPALILGKLSALWQNRWLRLYVALIFAGLLGSLLVNAYSSKNQGTLEIVAQSRCKLFDGSELLPGGSMSMGLSPGEYAIEVFNPRVEGHWETQRFQVRLGVTTHVTCRPR